MVKELMQLMQVAVEDESPPVKPVVPDTNVVDAIANANFKTVGEAAKRQMFSNQVQTQQIQNRNAGSTIQDLMQHLYEARNLRQEAPKPPPPPPEPKQEEVCTSGEERLTKVKRKIQYECKD
jgi:hypothetical protein